MGLLFLEYLDTPQGRVFACKSCLALGGPGCITNAVHLASSGDLLSKAFHSRNGPAYLFSSAVNVTLGPPEERDMTTGRHLIRDLHCVACGHLVGWRYEYAYERREKYKEGKFILERLQIVDLDAATSASFAGLNAISVGLPVAVDHGIPLLMTGEVVSPSSAVRHRIGATNAMTNTSTAVQPRELMPAGAFHGTGDAVSFLPGTRHDI